MSERLPHQQLIDDLSRDLKPVRRVRPSTLALIWLVLVALFGDYLALHADLPAMIARLSAAPDMWLAASGSAVTAVLAVLAAFITGMPGRSARWALLPLPALAVWIFESGMGCLRVWHIPGVDYATISDSHGCFMFIVLLSLPLSLLLMVLLRWTFPLRPNLTLALGGLAAAGAAATLLNFFHPYDASVEDLLAHALAVAVVVGANRLFAGRLFR